ncbi:hypothetical protein ABI59_15700 [Acidobacteria bacterium Mor1]|nr:hypothetical protein ABI59_15700 [Acidobacteria bacterium Mor1]
MAEFSESSTARRSLLGIAAIFLIGLVAGSALTVVTYRFMVMPNERHVSDGGHKPPRGRPSPAEIMREELQLTDEQVEQIESIFHEHRAEIRRTAEEVRGKIREVLTDEQKEAFDNMPRAFGPPGPRGRRGPGRHGPGGRGPGGRRGPGGPDGGPRGGHHPPPGDRPWLENGF